MRKSLLITLLVLPGFALAQGVTFYKGNWQSLLNEAKRTGKPFFVDYYTDWCGPCKMMSKHTFTDNKVGSYGNQHFLAYKLNAEQGEGIDIASRSNIQGYPTVIFYNSEGKEIGRSLGFVDAESFLKLMEKYSSMNKSRNTGTLGPKQMKGLSANERASLKALFE